MNKTFRKILCLLLTLCMLFSAALTLVSCGGDDDIEVKEGEYTYRSWSTSLGTNWNPHTWEMSGDSSIMSYIESPLVDLAPLNTEEGTYQWVYEMATSITDVTKDNQADLTKYNVILPEGKTAAEVLDSYVYEIKLNRDAKWQNGDPINADTYIYSMQMLLNPDMKNYRANNYISGTSALAGAFNYYWSKDAGFYNAYTTKYASLAAAVAAEDVYIDVWEFWGAKGYTDAQGNACPQWVAIDDETVYGEAQDDPFTGAELYQYYGAYLEVGGGYEACAGIYTVNTNVGATWDGVGLYKVDDYTIRYVCNTAYEYNYFLTSCTSNWIVHKATYEANMKEVGGLLVTTYGTSKATTMAYGPYKIESFEDDKQIVFVQNENWYGYEENDNGYLYSVTSFEVDGEELQQYQTTKIIIDVMQQDVAYQKFLKGELTDYTPTAAELLQYAVSERLYRVDETYTMRWFFNTNLDVLKALDAGSKNSNTVVLSNYNFRKAMSLAIDRSDFVTVTEGWKPAYALMNSLYYYNIYEDPTSSYRNSDEAKQAICNLYGVEYGSDKIYKTLDEAYASINGYNLSEAKTLMKQACDELVAANLYTRGEKIKIQIGWAKGALTDADNAQLAKLNQYLNAALEGSGFGEIEFVAIGNLPARYDSVIAGDYAIGWGAWGGAAFYPFGMFQCYMDPDYTKIHEAGCWDPETETLALTFKGDNGETITDTMTWQLWSQSMEGTGKYANYSNEVKLQILALLEEKYLELYYCIPMAGTTICSLLSYQVDEYTENYNIMYSFGGFRLMSWNYTDAEWTNYVSSQGGTLNYK